MKISDEVIIQIIITIVVIIIALIIQVIIRKSIKRLVSKKDIEQSRAVFIKRISKSVLIFITLFILISIWGVDTDNLWVFITSMLGILAVSFIAVWSILSNIVSALFIFISDPFKIGDNIEIIPENIKGKVKDITLMYVVLEDEASNTIRIPNNFMFQKIIKIKNK